MLTRIILSASLVAVGVMGIAIALRPTVTSPASQEIIQEPIVVVSPPVEEEEIIQEPRDLEQMIRWQAMTFGIDPDMAVAIAQCESRLDPYASNPTSSAKGLYQFTDVTWEYIKATGHQFDAAENIRQFMIWWPIHREWWVCE